MAKMIDSMISVPVDDINKYFHTTTILKDWLLKDGYRPTMMSNKVLATMWQRPSLRTRVSFEAGFAQLGGTFLTLKAYPANGPDLIVGEDVRDLAAVMSSMCDLIMARVFEHKTIDGLAKHSIVPVINGMSDMAHPVQILTDLYTIWEKKGKLKGLKVAYLGEGTGNTCQDHIAGTPGMGLDFVLGHPDYSKYPLLQKLQFGLPDAAYKAEGDKRAKVSGATIKYTTDPIEAIKGADVVYTDTWIAMDKPEEKEAAEDIKKIFMPFQVNAELMKHAKPDAIFMHCLPAYRGNCVTAEVIDGPQSVIYAQAENRLHVEKGIMVELLKPIKK